MVMPFGGKKGMASIRRALQSRPEKKKKPEAKPRPASTQNAKPVYVGNPSKKGWEDYDPKPGGGGQAMADWKARQAAQPQNIPAKTTPVGNGQKSWLERMKFWKKNQKGQKLQKSY